MAKKQKKKEQEFDYIYTAYNSIIEQGFEGTNLSPPTQPQVERIISKLVKNDEDRSAVTLISLWKEKEVLKEALNNFDQVIKHLLGKIDVLDEVNYKLSRNKDKQQQDSTYK